MIKNIKEENNHDQNGENNDHDQPHKRRLHKIFMQQARLLYKNKEHQTQDVRNVALLEIPQLAQQTNKLAAKVINLKEQLSANKCQHHKNLKRMKLEEKSCTKITTELNQRSRFTRPSHSQMRQRYDTLEKSKMCNNKTI